MENINPEAAKQFILAMPIERTDLTDRTKQVLARYGVATVGELSQLEPEELLNMRNFGGPERVEEVREELAKYGIELGQIN
jgi:DNA-directed RNA polymerase alpha subunit